MASGFSDWFRRIFKNQRELAAAEEQKLLPPAENPGPEPEPALEGHIETDIETAGEPAYEPELKVADTPPSQPIAYKPKSNYPNLLLSMEYLSQITDSRLNAHFENGVFKFPELRFYSDESPVYEFTEKHNLTKEEYMMLIVAMSPHIQPYFFENKLSKYLTKGGHFPEIGGVKSEGMIPTGETVLFLLAGKDTAYRLDLRERLFSAENPLIAEHVIAVEEPRDGEPDMSGRLTIAKDYLKLFTTGEAWRPAFGPNFPAKLISTSMKWEDLVVSESVRNELDQIHNWLKFNTELLKDPALSARLKPGYRALFYGSPGTGKTLAATLLGKQLQKDVYRVDLSLIVSKYIGETEKNLQALFEVAENKNWILFFDEADALFGKRTAVSSSNDRYANQEVSYLLQRIEDYNGLVILASNFRNNLDQAFTRRFQCMINFPVPNVSERLLLWQQTFPSTIQIAPDISLEELARNFELTGAAILNVIQLACIQSCASGQPLNKNMLLQEIRKEYAKESKTM
jgi:hypothetical protein